MKTNYWTVLALFLLAALVSAWLLPLSHTGRVTAASGGLEASLSGVMDSRTDSLSSITLGLHPAPAQVKGLNAEPYAVQVVAIHEVIPLLLQDEDSEAYLPIVSR